MNELGQDHPPGGASGPARRGILQIHPSLRCNLSCAHCYSSSGPRARTELSLATVTQAISDAASMGYDVVSVSGGEPFLYRGLPALLAHAKRLGMVTTVTSNGSLLNAQGLDPVREHLDVLAMSLDGPPDVHNAMRASPTAFERLQRGIDAVRAAGIPFGIITTLTTTSWVHLPWIAEFAATNGASLLQIHPLELSGRGAAMEEEVAIQEILAKVYLLSFVLEHQYAGSMRIQLDLFHRDALRDEPEVVYASDVGGDFLALKPSDLVGLIVLEASGSVVPAAYGVSSRFAVCNVKQQRLSQAWTEYARTRYGDFRSLCREVFEAISAPQGPLLTSWHAELVAASHAARRAEAGSRPTACTSPVGT